MNDPEVQIFRNKEHAAMQRKAKTKQVLFDFEVRSQNIATVWDRRMYAAWAVM